MKSYNESHTEDNQREFLHELNWTWVVFRRKYNTNLTTDMSRDDIIG